MLIAYEIKHSPSKNACGRKIFHNFCKHKITSGFCSKVCEKFVPVGQIGFEIQTFFEIITEKFTKIARTKQNKHTSGNLTQKGFFTSVALLFSLEASNFLKWLT